MLLASGIYLSLKEIQVEQLHYIYQRIGFQCFQETLFEDAGKHLFDGELDARILVSYFPNLRGTLSRAEDYVNIFAGVAEHMPSESSVQEISKCRLYTTAPIRQLGS
jgi:hypothetical protein